MEYKKINSKLLLKWLRPWMWKMGIYFFLWSMKVLSNKKRGVKIIRENYQLKVPPAAVWNVAQSWGCRYVYPYILLISFVMMGINFGSATWPAISVHMSTRCNMVVMVVHLPCLATLNLGLRNITLTWWLTAWPGARQLVCAQLYGAPFFYY